MQEFLNKIRFYDFDLYILIHGAIHNHPWLNGFYLFFAKYGIVIIGLASIYLILRKRINALLSGFLAIGVAIGIDFLILLLWQRPRPFISHGDQIMMPITEGLRVSHFSFPSVHTYIAFAIATTAILYGHKRLGPTLLILALLVGIGRIGAGLHYPSDILGGILLGIVAGLIANLIIQKKQSAWE